MSLVKIRSPITVFYNGAYRPPGTIIELPEDEAKSLIERFGDIGDDEITNSLSDLEAIARMNELSAINGGTGNDG